MTEINTVLFDWGGVLIEDPAPGLMAYCARALGVPVADYIQAHKQHADPFQIGRITEAAFWQQVCHTLNCDTPQVHSLWSQAFRQVYTPRRDVFDLAAQLQKKGIKTALLSNTEAPAMAYYDEQGYGMFDQAIFSCAEGCRKPDPEIYVRAAARCSTSTQQCLFIDDRADFIRGALDAGLQAVLFDHPETVTPRLRQRFGL